MLSSASDVALSSMIKSQDEAQQPDGTVPFCKEAFEAVTYKLLVFPALLLTTIMSILLIASLESGWHLDGALSDWFSRNRATVQIFVQLLASLLGIAQVSTVRNVVNYSARCKLVRRSMTLDRLNFYNSLTTSQVNWSLPLPSLLVTLAFLAAASAPAALWAGALTPISVPHTISLNNTIAVPAYTSETESLWNVSWYYTEPVNTELGTFTYGAIRNRHGYLINDGSHASSLDQEPVMLTKADNSNYTYRGRSYGIGASVGINDTSLTSIQLLLNYTYFENGYQSLFSCEYNQSSTSTLELVTTDPRNIYLAKGGSPVMNTTDGGYYVADLSGNDMIVAGKSFITGLTGLEATETWKANYSAPYIYIVMMAKGSDYADLNNLQCEGSFVPTTFNVSVDVVNRVITVTPYSTADSENIDNTGFIANQAGDTFEALSLVSTTSYTSELGDMLNSNIYNVNKSGIETTKEAIYTRAVAESLQALADQRLFSYSGAQLIIARAANYQPVIIQTEVMRFGEDRYIYASAGLNAALVLAVAFVAINTKLWRGMPKWNFADVKSTIVASSAAGTSISQEVDSKHKNSGDKWMGNASDRKAGEVEVTLRHSLLGPALCNLT